jgi:VWFA-related protein
MTGAGLAAASAQAPQKERPRRVEQTPPATVPPPAGDDEVIRVDANLTNVLLTATGKDNRFLTTLGKDDIAVFENDVRQEIFTFQRETNLPLTLVILIDVTRSQENTLGAEKSAARTFIESVLRPQMDQAAVVSFAEKIGIDQVQTKDRGGLNRAIDRVSIQYPPEYRGKGVEDPGCDVDPRGCSAIWDSVYDTLNRVIAPAPAGARRAIILLTDGEDVHSVIKRDEAADLAVKDDTAIYAIGIGDRENYSVKEKELRKLAERTGGRAFFPESDADLRAAFAQIQDELRSQYLVAYASTNSARDGSYRRIRIEPNNPELKKQKVRLLYRQGYFAKTN